MSNQADGTKGGSQYGDADEADVYPEYAATEYAPLPPTDPNYTPSGEFAEPTRVYLGAEERRAQAAQAQAYQEQIVQIYSQQPPPMAGGVPYQPYQAYAPRAVEDDGPTLLESPRSQALAVVQTAQQPSRVAVVYPSSVCPPSPELIMVQRPDTQAADQFRMLRFRLVDRPPSQVIAVTGPTRGVGASTAAANLALSLAEAGRARVVLVDTDVRNARQHKIFGIYSDVGLTVELERRHANPESVARVVAVAAAMALLPAGRDVPNPTAMLGSDVMAHLLEDLRFMYDHVVLDMSPALERSDAAAIHNLVDSFVIVGMSGVTTLEELEKTEEKLPQRKISGVVLNSVPDAPKGLVRNVLHLMGSPKRRRRYLRRGQSE
jgi:capsular exopolysaccharide synthesis family protein